MIHVALIHLELRRYFQTLTNFINKKSWNSENILIPIKLFFLEICLLLNQTFFLYMFNVSFFFLIKGVIKQLSEQISTLNERMDEFSSRIEHLNSKFAVQKSSMSQQNLSLQGEGCGGSVPTNFFVSGLGNGTLIPHSTSSNQLNKESSLMEEVLFKKK